MHIHWIEKVIECEYIYFCLNMWIYLWVKLQPVGKEKWLDVSGLSASSVLYPKGSTSSWKDGEELTRGNLSLYSTHLTLFYCSSHQSFSKIHYRTQQTVLRASVVFQCSWSSSLVCQRCFPGMDVIRVCHCSNGWITQNVPFPAGKLKRSNIIRFFVRIDRLTTGGGRNTRSGYIPLRSHLHEGYGSMRLTELHNKMLYKELPRLTFAAILDVCLM